jgi:transcriptional regulator with XRE-family HTH domain
MSQMRTVDVVDENSSFADRLIYAMQARRVKQASLALSLGVADAAVSHYTSGRRVPKIENLRALCTALDVSADYFIGLINIPKKATK